MRKLTKKQLKDLELKNNARRLANLMPLRIMVCTCRRCDREFESCGRSQWCGCNSITNLYIKLKRLWS